MNQNTLSLKPKGSIIGSSKQGSYWLQNMVPFSFVIEDCDVGHYNELQKSKDLGTGSQTVRELSRSGSLRKRAAYISAPIVCSDISFLSVMDVSAMLIAEDIAALVGIKPSLPSVRLNRLSVDYSWDGRTDNLLLTPPGWYGSTYIPSALFLNL